VGDCRATETNLVDGGLEILARIIARKVIQEFATEGSWTEGESLGRQEPSGDLAEGGRSVIAREG
jgi:hypothetical protein